METLNYWLSGYIMPVLLFATGIIFASKLRFFFIVHPVRFVRTLKEASKGSGTSPFRALTQALAGTLGVGNMAGVATAICAGGAGAVFWMWISAICSMSVKYAEVSLAVQHRRSDGLRFFGGAMFYIYDFFSIRLKRIAWPAGALFAMLCLGNSLLTGNIVQMNSAAAVFPDIPPLVLGGITASVSFIVACGGAKRVTDVTLRLIPLLSAGYIIISMYIILQNAERLPGVISDIFSSAFSLNSVCGGAAGFAITRAIRFGVTRGIFSNESGCGTSPSAHAAANTKSPHHQGCFGIFEVFADTIVLCSMTAFVILLSGVPETLDGIPLTVYSYSVLAGNRAGCLIGISVILFAFATVICQSQYGAVALRYLTGKQNSPAKYIYFLLCSGVTVLGCVIESSLMWQMADFIISLMTALNVSVLLYAFFTRSSDVGNSSFLNMHVTDS